MRENRKALRELNDQFDQRSDEASLGTSELDLAADLLAAYQSICTPATGSRSRSSTR